MFDWIANRIRENTTVVVLVAIFMMVLLTVVIMVTLAFVTTRVDIDLAQVESKESTSEEQIILKVDAQGQYYLSIGTGRQNLLSSDELFEQLKTLRLKKPGLSILVVADNNAGYRAVSDALELLQKAEVFNIELVGKASDEIALP